MPDAIYIYLHGFLSSSRSLKAQQLVRFAQSQNSVQSQNLSIECRVPEIPEEPHLAFAAIEEAIAPACDENSVVGLVGSSLGGFYATVFAERYGLRAVLINPSVYPHLRFHEFIRADGEMTNPYTGRRFKLTEKDLRALEAMTPRTLKIPENFWLLAQTGDEVLDYRDAVAYYAGCRQTIEAGGDHAFQDFERHLPSIVNFLQYPPS